MQGANGVIKTFLSPCLPNVCRCIHLQLSVKEVMKTDLFLHSLIKSLSDQPVLTSVPLSLAEQLCTLVTTPRQQYDVWNHLFLITSRYLFDPLNSSLFFSLTNKHWNILRQFLELRIFAFFGKICGICFSNVFPTSLCSGLSGWF